MASPNRPPPTLHRNRRVNVSIDTKTLPRQGEAETWDEEGVAVPRYIPAWVLPQEDLDSLMAAEAGAAPNIIYARRLPIDPSPDPASFNRKDCLLVLFEICFCRQLGCQDKLSKKTEKYYPLLCALRRYWGRVDLVCIHPHRPRRQHPPRHGIRLRNPPR
jgi:hypothetical protein